MKWVDVDDKVESNEYGTFGWVWTPRAPGGMWQLPAAENVEGS